MVTLDLERMYPGTEVQGIVGEVSQQFSDKFDALEDQRNAAMTKVAEMVADVRRLERQNAAQTHQFASMTAQIVDLQRMLAEAQKQKAPAQ